MPKIITILALAANSLLLVLILLILATAKEDKRLNARYYIAGICFMLLNMLAILYGGHI